MLSIYYRIIEMFLLLRVGSEADRRRGENSLLVDAEVLFCGRSIRRLIFLRQSRIAEFFCGMKEEEISHRLKKSEDN